RHTRSDRDWSSDVCSSDLVQQLCLAALATRTGLFCESSQDALRIAVDVLANPAIDCPTRATRFDRRSGPIQSDVTDLGFTGGCEIGRASCRERGWSAGGAG